MAGEYDDLGLIPAETQPDPSEDLGLIPAEPPPQEPDMTPMRNHFKETLGKKQVTGIMDAIEAGWQQSVTGLASRGKAPESEVAPDASTMAKVASGIGQIAGDLPAIIAGTIGGGMAGTAVAPGPGTFVGAAAGGNAAPAAIRKILMDHYEKGDIKDANDFVARSMSVLWETTKEGGIGVLTAGAGSKVGKLVAPVIDDAAAPIVSKVAARLAQPTAEIATMTTAGAAIEGRLPNAEDFTVSALTVATINGVTKAATGGTKQVSKKMRQIYAETGITPDQVADEARSNPILQQELLMDNEEIPSAYKDLVEKTEEPKVTMSDVMNEPAPEISQDNLAVRTILEKVDYENLGPEKPGIKQRVGDTLSRLYTERIDRLNPINKAVEVMSENPKSLSADENPYQLARMANDHKAKVKHVIEKGTIDFKTLEKTGKGLKEIVDPFKGNLKEFEAYLISKRSLDYEKRGLGSGFDPEAAREVVRIGKGKYEQAAKDLVEFQRRNLEYVRDAGLISEKSFKAMVSAGENYIPLKRLVEPEQFENVRTKKGAMKRVKGVEEGTDIKTKSPLLSIMENTEVLMKMAEKNRAVEAFVKQAEATGDSAIIEKVKAKSRPIEVTSKEVEKFFKDNGIDGDAEAFNIFRPNPISLADNEFEVIRNGKREVFRTDKELAQAIKSLDGDIASSNLVLKLARGITTIKKWGISLTPEFITRNFLRDQMMSAATSKGHIIPFVDVVVAMGDIVKKNDKYYNWLKSGGANGAFMEINESYLKKDVFKLDKSTGLIESTWNVIKKPVEAFEAGAQLIEQAPRLAEFKKVSGGESSGRRVFEGGFAAREVTLDFQRMGAKMSAYNMITAFTNATIQGADKAARALRDNPAGVTMKAAAFITAPSIYLWWANKDDERYKAIPRWEKDLYWHLITDDWQKAGPEDNPEFFPEHLTRVVGDELQINKGTVFRIPKPHEFGVLFGSLPERILEKYFEENPRAFKDFDETVLGILSPSIVPDIAAPGLEQWANKSIFTGRKLIPFHLEKVAPEYQYTDYTSETAKQLSKMTSYLAGPDRATSPIVIDNYVRQWGGTIGQYALEFADKALRDKGVVRPEGTLADIPAIRAFVTRYPSASAQQITDFYDRQKAVEQKLDTIRALGKKPGMGEELENYINAVSGESMATLSGTAQAISNSRKLIQSINANPEISPKEKRQLIDGQYHLMIESAKVAMEIADEMDKQLEEAKNVIAGSE
jgi:hypothetical protein